jgi:hypothetical protein
MVCLWRIQDLLVSCPRWLNGRIEELLRRQAEEVHMLLRGDER